MEQEGSEGVGNHPDGSLLHEAAGMRGPELGFRIPESLRSRGDLEQITTSRGFWQMRVLDLSARTGSYLEIVWSIKSWGPGLCCLN